MSSQLSSDGQIEFGHLVDESGQSIRLAGRNLIVGRVSSQCDVALGTHDDISGQHARVVRSGRRVTIEDLNSTNGTFVNDERIERPVELSGGDRVQFGTRRFEFRATDLAPASATDSGSSPAAISGQKWFAEIDGDYMGPLTDDGLRGLVLRGELTRDAMVHTGDVFRSRLANDVEILAGCWSAGDAAAAARAAAASTPLVSEATPESSKPETPATEVDASAPAKKSSAPASKSAKPKSKKAKLAEKRKRERIAEKKRQQAAAAEAAKVDELVEDVLLAEPEPEFELAASVESTNAPDLSSSNSGASPATTASMPSTSSPVNRPSPSPSPSSSQTTAAMASTMAAAMARSAPSSSPSPRKKSSNGGSFSMPDLPWAAIGIGVAVILACVGLWYSGLFGPGFDPNIALAQLKQVEQQMNMLEMDKADATRWKNLEEKVKKDTEALVKMLLKNATTDKPANCEMLLAADSYMMQLFNPDREQAAPAVDKFRMKLASAEKLLKSQK